jgi:hypothetical protein
MARRPDYGKKQEIWSGKDLEEMPRYLAALNEPAGREVYQHAY